MVCIVWLCVVWLCVAWVCIVLVFVIWVCVVWVCVSWCLCRLGLCRLGLCRFALALLGPVAVWVEWRLGFVSFGLTSCLVYTSYADDDAESRDLIWTIVIENSL